MGIGTAIGERKVGALCENRARPLERGRRFCYTTNICLWDGSAKSYRDGRWHQAGVTHDGTTVRVYVDGALAGMAETTWALPNWCYFDLAITGAGSAGARKPCAVEIDELAVYNETVLTADQISATYSAFCSVPSVETEAVKVPAPVAWYRFDDPTNVGKDSSGNEYDLTPCKGTASGGSMCEPTVDPASPIFGGMYNGRAGNGYLKWVGESLPEKIPSGIQPSTVSLWVNVSGSPVQNASKSWAVFQLGTRRIGMKYDDTCRRLAVMNSGNVRVYSPLWFSQREEKETAWHHLAYTHNGSKYQFYVDGQYVGEKENTDSVSTGVFYIGQSTDTTNQKNQYFKGNLDEVKIYDSVLSADQIYADYRSQLPRTDNVISPDTEVAVAASAKLTVDGATQALKKLTGAGSVALKNDAKLVLDGQCHNLTGQITGVGCLSVLSDATIGGTGIGPSGAIDITNATLTVTGTIANQTPVTIRAGGCLVATSAQAADIVYENGAELNLFASLVTKGRVTLKPGIVIRGSEEPTAWTSVLTADSITCEDGALELVTFAGLSREMVGAVKLVGNVLKARTMRKKGLVLVFR